MLKLLISHTLSRISSESCVITQRRSKNYSINPRNDSVSLAHLQNMDFDSLQKLMSQRGLTKRRCKIETVNKTTCEQWIIVNYLSIGIEPAMITGNIFQENHSMFDLVTFVKFHR